MGKRWNSEWKYYKFTKENKQLQEIINRLEEAIEKRGYDSIDEFW